MRWVEVTNYVLTSAAWFLAGIYFQQILDVRRSNA